MADLDLTKILLSVRAQYQLDWYGIHGIRHWARVMQNGLMLAESEGADTEVVRLFALFHDACRWNDGFDPQHGLRGAELAATLNGKLFAIDSAAMDKLYFACAKHTDGLTEADPTVQVCWDSDRLDLGRVMMNPNAKFLCTDLAKQHKTILWALQQSGANTHPDCLPDCPPND